MRLIAALMIGLLSTPAVALEEFPHLGIQALAGQVSKLGDSGLIKRQLSFELQRPLEKSLAALRNADSLRAIQQLDVFRRKVSHQLLPDLASGMVDQASSLQEQIIAISTRRSWAFVESCELPSPESFFSLDVGPGAAFATISDALTFASLEGFDAIELVLESAAYREGLITIDRHTRFIAPAGEANIVGGLLNNGPNLLELRNVIITGSSGTGLRADHPCAVTVLDAVEVQFAQGTGIVQQGGTFTANGLSVVLSAAPDGPATGDRDIGRGLHFSEGASACMTNVVVDANDAGGLLAEGYSTRVFASGLQARNNGVSPIVHQEIMAGGELTSGFGSIEIRDEALLLGQLLNVFSGQVAGFVILNDAMSHVRYSSISRTGAIAIGRYSSVGGRNILATSGAMEMTSTTSSLSDVGLTIDVDDGGALAASASVVTKNSVGAHIISSDGDALACAQRCLGDTRFPLNNRNAHFEGGFPPPPVPGDPTPACSCPSIDFTPSWCDPGP